jgi:hypothetical protein
MTETPDQQVRRLLDYFEARVNLEHVTKVRDRHRAAMRYEPIDRLPLVFYLPYEGEDFTPYPFSEAFVDPAKMMVNELLVGFTSLYHAVTLKDDAPYCLRPNLGTGIIASMFGANIRLLENNPPWAESIGGLTALEALAEAPLPDVTEGLGQRVLDQYAYFSSALNEYPRCQEAFQITLPDIQGAFSTVELLWGSGIYIDLYDHSDLIQALLDKVTVQMVRVFKAWRPYVYENIGEGFCYQHNVGVSGNLLIRDDSMILLSPEMYKTMVLPFDAKLIAEVHGAGIHFCGNGQHQIENLLSIAECTSIDFGQPEMNDLDSIYKDAAKDEVALTRIQVPVTQLTTNQTKARFPTGINLIHQPQSVLDAEGLWARYCENHE